MKTTKQTEKYRNSGGTYFLYLNCTACKI